MASDSRRSLLCACAGVLIPADASLGAVDVQGRVFGCSTREAQRLFMAQPMEYIAAVELAVRSSPEVTKLGRPPRTSLLPSGAFELPRRRASFSQLVKLLGMSELFPSLSLAHLVSLADKGTKCDFGTQTLRHVKDRNVDVNYDWNVWSLRRRALNLANLENKQTKSGQTGACAPPGVRERTAHGAACGARGGDVTLCRCCDAARPASSLRSAQPLPERERDTGVPPQEPEHDDEGGQGAEHAQEAPLHRRPAGRVQDQDGRRAAGARIGAAPPALGAGSAGPTWRFQSLFPSTEVGYDWN